MQLLEVENLSKTYGSGEAAVHALRGASFTVPKGEFVAVVGESGSGKSTLLNLIGGLDTPTAGRVYIDGRDIFTMKDRSLTVFRRRNIGFVFQSFNLIPELTVEQNILFPVLLDYQRPDRAYLEEMWEPVKKWFRFQKQKFDQRGTYKYFKCPNCKQQLRAPRGRGKIEVTCQKCHTVFRTKT